MAFVTVPDFFGLGRGSVNFLVFFVPEGQLLRGGN